MNILNIQKNVRLLLKCNTYNWKGKLIYGGVIMKRFLFLLIGLSIVLVACNKSVPEIQVNTVISNLNLEEFNNLGVTDEYGEVSKNDFKKLTFDFSMQHDEGVERKIEMFDNWRNLLNTYDGFERYWTGNNTTLDNSGDSFAEYHYDIIFYSKGLTEEDIKEIFSEASLYVEWINSEGKQSKTYVISDTITFKK